MVPGVFENFNLFDFQQYAYWLFKLVFCLIIPQTVSQLLPEGFYRQKFVCPFLKSNYESIIHF